MNTPTAKAQSFIVYVLISRNGINKGGQPDFEYREEDIKTLYPEYSADSLPESIVQWIEEGILEEDMIAEDISHWHQEGERTAASRAIAEPPSNLP